MTRQYISCRKKITNIFQSTPPEVKRKLILMLSFLIIFNTGIWIAALFFSFTNPVLLGLITLAYGMGLRHAVDADHIAAIDNVTRKLLHDGKRPVAVGFFFSLGHSTVVIILSLMLAFSASFIKDNLPSFKETGAIIGTSISSIFLLAIGIINLIILIDIFKLWKKVTKGEKDKKFSIEEYINTRTFATRLLRPLFRTVKHSWNMYIIGFLFGLGFDTASEVGLLSLSAAAGADNINVWIILSLPLAFTAGMSLIDTLDGILMLGAYGWANIKPLRKLYYNLNITLISVLIALFLGGIEALQVISGQLKLQGEFFNVINNLDFGNLGFFIVGFFIISWCFSILIYKFKGYDRHEMNIQ